MKSYIVLNDGNEWLATCTSKREAIAEARELAAEGRAGVGTGPEIYVYQAIEVGRFVEEDGKVVSTLN